MIQLKVIVLVRLRNYILSRALVPPVSDFFSNKSPALTVEDRYKSARFLVTGFTEMMQYNSTRIIETNIQRISMSIS